MFDTRNCGARDRVKITNYCRRLDSANDDHNNINNNDDYTVIIIIIILIIIVIFYTVFSWAQPRGSDSLAVSLTCEVLRKSVFAIIQTCGLKRTRIAYDNRYYCQCLLQLMIIIIVYRGAEVNCNYSRRIFRVKSTSRTILAIIL